MSAFDVNRDGTAPDLEGLEVASIVRSDHIDTYGGRKRRDGSLAHAGNTNPPQPGWLGNPYQMDDDADETAERRRVIAAWTDYLLERVKRDDDFEEALERLRGDRVGCWCRGTSQERTEDNWCHLDVVDAWLRGDLSPVYRYLRGDDA